MISKESRGKVLKILGEYGSYFLSMVHLAEEIIGKRIDAVEVYMDALEKKWIDDKATMYRPDAVLSVMIGQNFTVVKETADYKPWPDEYEILVIKSKYIHYVLGGNGSRGIDAYDPLGNSEIDTTGIVAEKRIFRKV
jgi:hypothetical protein